jgi:hypothetical protein
MGGEAMLRSSRPTRRGLIDVWRPHSLAILVIALAVRFCLSM